MLQNAQSFLTNHQCEIHVEYRNNGWHTCVLLFKLTVISQTTIINTDGNNNHTQDLIIHNFLHYNLNAKFVWTDMWRFVDYNLLSCNRLSSTVNFRSVCLLLSMENCILSHCDLDLWPQNLTSSSWSPTTSRPSMVIRPQVVCKLSC